MAPPFLFICSLTAVFRGWGWSLLAAADGAGEAVEWLTTLRLSVRQSDGSETLADRSGETRVKKKRKEREEGEEEGSLAALSFSLGGYGEMGTTTTKVVSTRSSGSCVARGLLAGSCTCWQKEQTQGWATSISVVQRAGVRALTRGHNKQPNQASYYQEVS